MRSPNPVDTRSGIFLCPWTSRFRLGHSSERFYKSLRDAKDFTSTQLSTELGDFFLQEPPTTQNVPIYIGTFCVSSPQITVSDDRQKQLSFLRYRATGTVSGAPFAYGCSTVRSKQ